MTGNDLKFVRGLEVKLERYGVIMTHVYLDDGRLTVRVKLRPDRWENRYAVNPVPVEHLKWDFATVEEASSFVDGLAVAWSHQLRLRAHPDEPGNDC